MLSHFQYKQIGPKVRKPKWEVSFFYQGAYYRSLYLHNGEFDWFEPSPKEEDKSKLQSQIHELMLFHVYENPANN
ncbi:DUF5342 family protein [Guptibacillus algicola]|uniref:DUF5342 family protein n=1 Tax=Guptibacillus algicola TaxID=225844 RepID=UPI001CD58D1D|nr:DUF5342 family protein [Alkalihalobacillus algicola]MCA0989215.1 YheE family protein [Alkalihalobacillus algicola]